MMHCDPPSTLECAERLWLTFGKGIMWWLLYPQTTNMRLLCVTWIGYNLHGSLELQYCKHGSRPKYLQTSGAKRTRHCESRPSSLTADIGILFWTMLWDVAVYSDLSGGGQCSCWALPATIGCWLHRVKGLLLMASVYIPVHGRPVSLKLPMSRWSALLTRSLGHNLSHQFGEVRRVLIASRSQLE